MRKILIVEDEKELLKVLEKFLAKKGFEVLTASGGDQALEMIKSAENIDFIILDIKMPKVSGFDVLKEIRKFKKDIPAVFLTGAINKTKYSDVVKSLGCSIDDIIEKPVDLYKFLDIIERKLKGQTFL